MTQKTIVISTHEPAMIILKEYGKLIQGEGVGDLSLGFVSLEEDWHFLQALAHSENRTHHYLRISRYAGKPALQVTHFVGVITTPSGLHIEILPKINTSVTDAADARALLWTMLRKTPELNLLQATDANLKLADHPLLDVLIGRFLQQLASVVRKGIRKDYHRIHAEEPFLKGSLSLVKQLRQPLGRQQLFHIEYDVFSDNRAENRLIHSALIRVAHWSKQDTHKRLAQQLRFAFDNVPYSDNIQQDLQRWQTGRDMVYYQPLLPWLQLIFNQQCPKNLKDAHAGISFLIPMNQLFELYVYHTLPRYEDETLVRQASAGYLSDDPKAFMLKPDIIRKNKEGEIIEILDTKWKLIDESAQYSNGHQDEKWGISQADVYQMFGYGKKLLPEGKGKVTLIYPQWAHFSRPKSLDLGEGLMLNIRPMPLI